jgi:hypothetical protein
MRQRDQIEPVVLMHNAELAANYMFQFCAFNESHYRKSTDRNDEAWLQNSDFIVHPQCTVTDLIRCWHAIAAARAFAGETAADCSEIDLRSNSGFTDSAKLFEPAEECFARSMRKRPLQSRLSWTGRLANDHDIAQNGTT